MLRPPLVLLSLGSLAASVDSAGSEVSNAPSLAVQGCLRDVSGTTNNGRVEVLESIES